MSPINPAPRHCLAEITSCYLMRPYALGSRDGFDCFSLIHDYLGRVGAELPDEFQGQTLQSYASLFDRDSGEAKRVMVEFVASVTDEIEPHRAFAGDILLLKLTGSEALPFLAIHAGQNLAIAASCEFGVRPWELGHYTIVRAFRCRRQSR